MGLAQLQSIHCRLARTFGPNTQPVQADTWCYHQHGQYRRLHVEMTSGGRRRYIMRCHLSPITSPSEFVNMSSFVYFCDWQLNSAINTARNIQFIRSTRSNIVPMHIHLMLHKLGPLWYWIINMREPQTYHYWLLGLHQYICVRVRVVGPMSDVTVVS